MKKKAVSITLACVIFGFMLGFILISMKEVWLYRLEMRAVTLESGETLVVATARTRTQKARGLSGRDKVPRDGLLFVYDAPQDAGIWMKNMNFPIDIVWITNGRVARIVENALPDNSSNREIYRAGEPVEYVLEMESGEANRLGIKLGDMVNVSNEIVAM